MDKRSIDDILETIKPLTDEEKVAYLFDIIHEEVSKPWDEVDQELVAACSECAEKYNQNVAPALTEDDVEQRLVEFKQNYGKKVRKPIRTNWVRKVAIIAAAAVLTCMLTLTVAARAYGFQNIGEFVVYAIDNLFPGGVVDKNTITYVYNGEITIYNNIQDWCDAENLEMMYPNSLPQEVFVESISKQDNPDGTSTWVFNFNEESLTLIINNYYSVDLTNSDGNKHITSSGQVFYVIHDRQAVYQNNKYEYIIQSDNIEWLTTIMEGIKKK